MGKMSKQKGKRGEREVKDLHNEFFIDQGLDIRLERNQMQSAVGGYDLVGLDFLAIEVKHCEVFQLAKWWAQTMNQMKDGQVPVLFYRRNRVPWRVMMIGCVINSDEQPAMIIDIAVDDYFRWLATKLRSLKSED